MSIAFLLIIVSALFYAVWNMLVKISDDKVMYNVHMVKSKNDCEKLNK